MKKIIVFFICFTCFFSCERPAHGVLGVTDIVTSDLPFIVLRIPCEDQDDPACQAKPVVDATIQIYKIEEGENDLRFIAEDKTNPEGKLKFYYVPLGSYQAKVSTNEYGDTTVGAESYSGRASEIRVKFY